MALTGNTMLANGPSTMLIDSIKSEVEKVRLKDLLYVVFCFDKCGTQLVVKEAKENPSRNDKLALKKEEVLRERFATFKTLIRSLGGCYAIFDFETGAECGTPRSIFFLVIVVPDDLDVRTRFLYSSNAQKIADQVGIAVKQVQINQHDDLTYDYLKQMCLSLKKG
ncbi:cofilin [Nematocida homosporus]|uniref:cofilin n=1 Tax=Nematocida homosporus TaxID=1912981 RepID=UPI002220ACFE|nr:cofilin [Nematocida homosporus]KAI5186365.1 cofilin [Nematocida homosporus]